MNVTVIGEPWASFGTEEMVEALSDEAKMVEMLSAVTDEALTSLREELPKRKTSYILGLMTNSEALERRMGPGKGRTVDDQMMVMMAAAVALADEIDRRVTPLTES